jgi:hypothetical protein
MNLKQRSLRPSVWSDMMLAGACKPLPLLAAFGMQCVSAPLSLAEVPH